MKIGRDSPAAMLRMPQDLKVWLQHRAIDNLRSLNSEIVHRLKQSREQEQKGEQPQGAQQ
jgi:hypothetical protein